MCKYTSSPLAQEPDAGHGRLILEGSRSHSDMPQSVGLLWTSDRLVAETSTWQTHNSQKREIAMPAIVESDRLQILALDRSVTGIGV
jgi:hypothetical protein